MSVWMACTYNFEKRATLSHFTECAAPNICTTYGKIVYTVHLPYSCGCNGEYAKMRLFDFDVASFGRVFLRVLPGVCESIWHFTFQMETIQPNDGNILYVVYIIVMIFTFSSLNKNGRKRANPTNQIIESVHFLRNGIIKIESHNWDMKMILHTFNLCECVLDLLYL